MESDNRITIVNIIIHDRTAAAKVNELLSEFADRIVGRMGLPYSPKNVSIICLVMDAPPGEVNSLSGKLGMIKGVTSKTHTAKV
ncbi:MAG: iron-only hydrogenase system regulator [Oscillospiraceae bacterium]|nr:iron-only hydrogenase system regulator [Oscillospiraceae bacterium]